MDKFQKDDQHSLESARFPVGKWLELMCAYDRALPEMLSEGEENISMQAGGDSCKICEACALGLNHIKEGIQCQDKICSLHENGVTAAALAEGAESASFSHVGADTAVRALCKKLWILCFRVSRKKLRLQAVIFVSLIQH